MRNCTAEETQRFIVQKYGYNCREGSFCRFTYPDKYVCECLPGWTGPLCSDWDFSLGSASVFLPLICIAVLLVVVSAVLGIFVCHRVRTRGQASSGI